MSLPPLSLAALPAIPSLATQALRTGATAGNHFLSLLSSVTSLQPSTSAGSELSQTASSTSNAHKDNPSDSLSRRTLDFGQRLMSWLRQQGGAHDLSQPLSVELSLDNQDQPHALVNGKPNAAVDQALQQNPGWLQEFRDLALDRLESMSGLAWAATAPMTLTIQSQSDTMVPNVGWN